MEQAGTPCPFEGKIGKKAKAAWKKYNKLKTRLRSICTKFKNY